MNRFELARPRSLTEARELVQGTAGAVFKAGGIDVLDHLKERLWEPPRLVDLKSVPGMSEIVVEPDGGLRLGPLVTLAKVAAHPVLRKTHTALAQACGEAASPQIRNVATLGGNVLQRPRCWYYRLESYRCVKKGGDVCFAVGGENRYHVLFGGGPVYVPHPSNAATALVALGASFVLEGPKEKRTVAAGDFFILPSKNPERENVLGDGEVLTEIRLPAAAGVKSVYASVRERAAFDWPLVAMAAAVRIEAGAVADSRVVLGAVAPTPWRSTRTEQALRGKKLDGDAAEAAARAAIVGAAPLSDNGYKVPLLQALVRRTLLSMA